MDAPGRLSLFFASRGLSQRAAASELQISQAHVSGILDRRCRPGADLRVRIEELTALAEGGPIRLADWSSCR